VLGVAAEANSKSGNTAPRIPDVVRGLFFESVVGLERACLAATKASVFWAHPADVVDPKELLSYGLARLFLAQVQIPNLTGLTDDEFIALHEIDLASGYPPLLGQLASSSGISTTLDRWGRLSPTEVKERVSRAVQFIAEAHSFVARNGLGQISRAATLLANHTCGPMSYHRGYPKDWTQPAALAFLRTIQELGSENNFIWADTAARSSDLPIQWKRATSIHTKELAAAKLASEAAEVLQRSHGSAQLRSKSSSREPRGGRRSGYATA
jgi:hypothetical protein